MTQPPPAKPAAARPIPAEPRVAVPAEPRVAAPAGRILRLKYGYNPNSSSIGTIVFALPGSPAAARLALERLILPELGHAVREMTR